MERFDVNWVNKPSVKWMSVCTVTIGREWHNKMRCDNRLSFKVWQWVAGDEGRLHKWRLGQYSLIQTRWEPRDTCMWVRTVSRLANTVRSNVPVLYTLRNKSLNQWVCRICTYQQWQPKEMSSIKRRSTAARCPGRNTPTDHRHTDNFLRTCNCHLLLRNSR